MADQRLVELENIVKTYKQVEEAFPWDIALGRFEIINAVARVEDRTFPEPLQLTVEEANLALTDVVTGPGGVRKRQKLRMGERAAVVELDALDLVGEDTRKPVGLEETLDRDSIFSAAQSDDQVARIPVLRHIDIRRGDEGAETQHIEAATTVLQPVLAIADVEEVGIAGVDIPVEETVVAGTPDIGVLAGIPAGADQLIVTGATDQHVVTRLAIQVIPGIAALIGVRIHSAFVTSSPSAPSGIQSISNTFTFSIVP